MPQSSLPFLLAIALALVLTPISRRLAVRIGAIDNPGERRIHAVATPRLGGPAILLAIVLALFCAALLDRSAGMALRSHWHQLLAVAIGALAVTLAGTIDDVHPLAPSSKLVVEIAAAACRGLRWMPNRYAFGISCWPAVVSAQCGFHCGGG